MRTAAALRRAGKPMPARGSVLRERLDIDEKQIWDFIDHFRDDAVRPFVQPMSFFCAYDGARCP